MCAIMLLVHLSTTLPWNWNIQLTIFSHVIVFYIDIMPEIEFNSFTITNKKLTTNNLKIISLSTMNYRNRRSTVVKKFKITKNGKPSAQKDSTTLVVTENKHSNVLESNVQSIVVSNNAPPEAATLDQ